MVLALMAQDIPGQKQTESALDTLASQGVLGSLCVLLIVALFFTIKALLKAKDDRFTDQKQMSEILERHNEAAKELAIELNKSMADLVNQATKSMDQAQNALLRQENSLDDLTRAVTALQQETITLRVMSSNFKCSGSKV